MSTNTAVTPSTSSTPCHYLWEQEGMFSSSCSWDFTGRAVLVELAPPPGPPPDGRCERSWIRVRPRQGLHFGSPYRIYVLASNRDGERQGREIAITSNNAANALARARREMTSSRQQDLDYLHAMYVNLVTPATGLPTRSSCSSAGSEQAADAATAA
ncbi:hypothetical protein KOW79_002927 [Hemibagrus wyckioides]|uniref:Uncharacterized protein n=1 Tax=Hemibagrus wyckioides TaxID=337641 RepID=A0A9D3STJ5_9TELE|nr:hypothetical protein KOW79_002927 [Hemibagrus wyckioides]